MNNKIVIRQRFPNFVCDGRPLGNDNEAYMSRIDTSDEFFELDWVKEKSKMGCVGWFISDDEYIMAVYREDDGTGSCLCHALLEGGVLDIDKQDNWFDHEEAIMQGYGLKLRKR